MKRKIYLVIGTGNDLYGNKLIWNVKAFMNENEAVKFVKKCECELNNVKMKESLLLKRYEYIITTEKTEFDGLHSLDKNLFSYITEVEYEIENFEIELVENNNENG